MKKVELHLHLDGSLNPSTVSELTGKDINEVKNEMIVNNNVSNLKEYIDKFNLPISVMQTKENLIRVSYELCENLKKEDVIYAEIRFAPMFHTKSGLTEEEVVEAVLEGINKCEGIYIGLILCMMRGLPYEENIKVISLAQKYKNKGVVGIDLAGDEANYKTSLYKDLFLLAKENNIPFTIHAGEADGPSSIKDAISFGASRIGHGIRSIEDEKILSLIKEKDILLEVCPKSNVDTKAIDEYKNHPIKELINKGIKVSINTDNRTVSNITLEEEYSMLKNIIGLTDEDIKKCNILALEKSFINDELKKVLTEKL